MDVFTPVLGNNALIINEGETVILNTANLSATDIDNNDGDLLFTITNVQYGRFERKSNIGVAIASFTQQEIIDGGIQFVHDGSENQPMYDVSVSDGLLSSGPVSASITFSNNVNDMPALIHNELVINKGQTVVLNPIDLDTLDPDNIPSELIYTVSNVQHAKFEQISNPSIAITSFTKKNIMDGGIQIIHDGSGILPEYSVEVHDGGV